MINNTDNPTLLRTMGIMLIIIADELEKQEKTKNNTKKKENKQ